METSLFGNFGMECCYFFFLFNVGLYFVIMLHNGNEKSMVL